MCGAKQSYSFSFKGWSKMSTVRSNKMMGELTNEKQKSWQGCCHSTGRIPQVNG
jgi:hypothetical protein